MSIHSSATKQNLNLNKSSSQLTESSLYNGNIVLRGSGGGKGKGKGGGGNIVVANSQPHDSHVEMMPPMFDMWQGMGRRR